MTYNALTITKSVTWARIKHLFKNKIYRFTFEIYKVYVWNLMRTAMNQIQCTLPLRYAMLAHTVRIMRMIVRTAKTWKLLNIAQVHRRLLFFDVGICRWDFLPWPITIFTLNIRTQYFLVIFLYFNKTLLFPVAISEIWPDELQTV